MRRKALSAAFILALLIVAQTIQLILFASGEGIPLRMNWGFFEGTTYVGQPVVFSPTVSGGTPPYSYQWYTQLYSDQGLTPAGEVMPASTDASFTFISWSPGWYAISVRVQDSLGNHAYFFGGPTGIWVHVLPYVDSARAYVDTTPPKITILATQNTTYDSSNFFLRFALNESAVWIGYTLDGKDNVSITEDVNETIISVGQHQISVIETTIISGLSNGTHTLTVYATDAAGNTGESETLHFTVAQETQPQQTEPSQPQPSNSGSFPTTLVAVSVAVIVAVVSFGLAAYFLRRKGKRSEA